MAPALSKDLVWRIVKKRLLYDDTFKSISRQLDLPVSTVHKIFTRVEQRHGDLETYQGMRVALPANSKLDGQQRMDLFQLICTADAGMQLNEIAVEFRNRYGIHLEVYDIARAMVVHNFTHKRLSLLAKKCDYRQSLLVQIELMENYTLRQLVWMDEFGKRKKPPQRTVGWSLRGEPAQSF